MLYERGRWCVLRAFRFGFGDHVFHVFDRASGLRMPAEHPTEDRAIAHADALAARSVTFRRFAFRGDLDAARKLRRVRPPS